MRAILAGLIISAGCVDTVSSVSAPLLCECPAVDAAPPPPVDAAPPPPVDAAPPPVPGCGVGSMTNGAHSVVVAGQSRGYLVQRPTQIGPRPLVVAWHGTGESGSSFYSRANLGAWRTAGWIVLTPESNGNGELWPVWDSQTVPGWPNGDNADLALFDWMVACARQETAVDATRIFTLGHSAGGAMTNHVLGQRSSVLAGGIPASGAIDWTQPPPATIDPMAVIVTWGGDNDCWSGCAGGTCVESCLVEQAALTTQYWEGTPGVHQIRCRGNNVGHAWLGGVNTFMRNWLFAHPKGSASVPGPTLPSSCSETVYTWTPPLQPVCRASATVGCQDYCQLIGDCIVENGTLGSQAANILPDLGWTATPDYCGGCVSLCEQDATTQADANALACIANAPLVCEPGFEGMNLFSTVGECCVGGGSVCDRFCDAFGSNPLFAQFTPWCP